MVEPAARVPDQLLHKLNPVSNATVLGLLLRRGYSKTFMQGVRPLAMGRRLVGRAVTLRYLPSRPDLQKRIAFSKTADGMNDTPRWRALEALGQGDVLVADAMGLSGVSTGGNVVFSRILTKSAAGLVTDGAVRDGPAVVKYGYPVYAGGSTPTVGEPNVLPYEVNEPIQCGGVLVWPGDVIMGDDEGVVVLPAQLAAELVDEAIEHDEMEEALLEYTMERKVSPSAFYPFNDETRKIHEAWKKRKR